MSKRNQQNNNCCHICKLEEPPSSTSSKKVQPGRAAKSRVGSISDIGITWIRCDIGKHWCHSDCCGLTPIDHKKLTTGNQYFKCVQCCVSASCCFISGSVKSECRECQSDAVVKPISEFQNPVQRQAQIEENTKPDKSFPSAIPSVSSRREEVRFSPSSVSERKVDEEQSERENIVIVDNIANPAKFLRSDSILKEVNRFAPSVQVKYAYSLAKGGVAIHLNNIPEKQSLLQCLTPEAFGGAKIYDLATKTETLLLRNVPTHISLESVRLVLQQQGTEVVTIQRQCHRVTGRPQPVIRLVCSHSTAEQLAGRGSLTVNHYNCIVARKYTNVLRCYNCQQFGHISRLCKNQSCCINCSDCHNSGEYCQRPPRCANCQGRHKASDRSCPVYRDRYALFTGKRPEPEYIKKSPRADSIGSSVTSDVIAGNLGTKGDDPLEGLSASSV